MHTKFGVLQGSMLGLQLFVIRGVDLYKNIVVLFISKGNRTYKEMRLVHDLHNKIVKQSMHLFYESVYVTFILRVPISLLITFLDSETGQDNYH